MDESSEYNDGPVVMATEGVEFSLGDRKYETTEYESRKLGENKARHFNLFFDGPLFGNGPVNELNIVLRVQHLNPSSSEKAPIVDKNTVLRAHALSTDMNVASHAHKFCALARRKGDGSGETELTLINAVTLEDANAPGRAEDMSDELRASMIEEAAKSGAWQLVFMDEGRGVMAFPTPVVPVPLSGVFARKKLFDDVVSGLYEASKAADGLLVRVVDDLLE